MGSKRALIELVEHNGWANQLLISFCAELSPEQLTAVVPGVFGSALETLQHIVDSEGSYTRRLTARWPDHPWKDDWDVDLATLAERADVITNTLKAFLETDWDSERLNEATGDGQHFSVRCSIFLSQLIHHGNEHRAQVCSALGAQGIEPPEVSAWEFALATGRMWAD
jgi:uncharacterized damage-inducible protein DinB